MVLINTNCGSHIKNPKISYLNRLDKACYWFNIFWEKGYIVNDTFILLLEYITIGAVKGGIYTTFKITATTGYTYYYLFNNLSE